MLKNDPYVIIYFWRTISPFKISSEKEDKNLQIPNLKWKNRNNQENLKAWKNKNENIEKY